MHVGTIIHICKGACDSRHAPPLGFTSCWHMGHTCKFKYRGKTGDAKCNTLRGQKPPSNQDTSTHAPTPIYPHLFPAQPLLNAVRMVKVRAWQQPNLIRAFQLHSAYRAALPAHEPHVCSHFRFLAVVASRTPVLCTKEHYEMQQKHHWALTPPLPALPLPRGPTRCRLPPAPHPPPHPAPRRAAQRR
jgi:hypothetical protein